LHTLLIYTLASLLVGVDAAPLGSASLPDQHSYLTTFM
jgi:hypothetical protein